MFESAEYWSCDKPVMLQERMTHPALENMVMKDDPAVSISEVIVKEDGTTEDDESTVRSWKLDASTEHSSGVSAL